VKVTPEQTVKLLQGDHIFSQLGFSMMLTRLKVLYAENPSDEVLQKAMDEINAFLAKFKPIMGPDYKIISDV
jgi:hypothetical protein